VTSPAGSVTVFSRAIRPPLYPERDTISYVYEVDRPALSLTRLTRLRPFTSSP
jgi:hypothetical protein